jgi:hypothetical protein
LVVRNFMRPSGALVNVCENFYPHARKMQNKSSIFFKFFFSS